MYKIDIRERRQTTLPRELMEELGLIVGDSIKVVVRKGQAILTPQKRIALDALEEIQKIFGSSSVSEKELQEEISSQRES